MNDETTLSNSPTICGEEIFTQKAVNHATPVYLPNTNLKLEHITSGFANALHMHQPTIPAGKNGSLICNLQYMYEHQGEGDNHNAGPFANCYSRLGEMIPQLISEGCNPRIMLDYSGNLLWGFQQMGRNDIIDNLKILTCEPKYQPHVEWLGTMWSHAVVSSTPIPDIKLHIQAWQQHFASIFGYEALARVKGFSPPEMHLPNYPDTLYEYIRALKDCGYKWLMVQEHTVENMDGSCLSREQKFIPNQLTARNSKGETVSITALIKTQGSDTKLVAQMQPYYEAKGLSKQNVGNLMIPSLVTQIADGENGGVMMNEFPGGYTKVYREMKNLGIGQVGTVAINGTEYLELLEAAGVSSTNYPKIQAIHQQKVWNKVDTDKPTTESMEKAIAELKQTDHQFSMDGASWTNNLNWIEGYSNVLEPMNHLSHLFHKKFDDLVNKDTNVTKQPDYKNALLCNLLLQTSCFRYWGQGAWTEYAKEIYQRGLKYV